MTGAIRTPDLPVRLPSGCNPEILKKFDLNPDRVEKPREKLKTTIHRQMQWPGSEPFPMWGVQDGSSEATGEFLTAESSIRLARGEGPGHLGTHFIAPQRPGAVRPAHHYAKVEQRDEQAGRIRKAPWTRQGRRRIHWLCSPPILATWWALTACGSRAGLLTKSATGCR